MSCNHIQCARAAAGDSFVLRGPPGCGKTQTLANIICSLVARGKRVLIVAKVRTALSVLVRKVCNRYATALLKQFTYGPVLPTRIGLCPYVYIYYVACVYAQ